MYCVICGKEEKLYEHLCKDCFLEKNTFFKIPEVIKISICSHCYNVQKGNHWEESRSDEEAIKNRIIDNIRKNKKTDWDNFSIDLEPTMTNVVQATVTAISGYEDLEVSEQLITEVRINYSVCPRCSRRLGNYFEAIIQVRASNRHLNNDEKQKVQDMVNTNLNSLDSNEQNAFITKIEEIHGGLDFYVGSSNAARQVAKNLSKQLNGKIHETSSLVGRKEGRDIHRNTILIRIPEYGIGEFVRLNDNIYQVKKVHMKTVTCVNLKTGRKTKVDRSAFDDGLYLGGSELVFDAVVILDSTKEIQILDPVNYQTVELIKPKEFKVFGETVKIFKHLDMIYLIPD